MPWIQSRQKQSSPGPTPTYENYIYNVGNCAFNTGYKHKANTKIKFKAILESFQSGVDWKNAWGACNGSFRANCFIFCSRADSTKLCFLRTNSYVQGDTVDAPETSVSANWQFVPCIFEAFENTISWYREEDTNTIRHITTSGTVNDGIAPLAIFNSNNASTADGWSITANATALMRLFWFEIYENDVLLHRFVPAYNNNQYCLYDEIDQVYIYDQINNGAYMRGFIQ